MALFDTLLFYFHHPNANLPVITLPLPIEVLYQPPDNKPDVQTAKMLINMDAVELYVWPHQVPTLINQRVTHFIFSFYPYHELENWLMEVRKHGVTLNSVFNACMLVTAEQLLAQPYNGGLSTPVSLRGYTNHKVNQNNVAFLCGIINSKHPDILNSTDLWQLAWTYQQQLHTRFDLLTLPSPKYDFAAIKESMTTIWDPQRKTFCYDFMVTNLGLVKFENISSDFMVRQFRFGTCRSAGDNNIMLLVSATNEGLFFTFGYTSPLITDDWAKNFVAIFNTQLKALFNLNN